MPKNKKSPKPSSDAPKSEVPGADAAEESDEALDQSPKVRKAADAVEKAKAELEKAQSLYRKVRQETADRLKDVREKSVGDLIDGTLDLVKKHPGPGVILAAVVGFFFGRLFRR